MDTHHLISDTSSKHPKLLTGVKNCLRDKHCSLRTNEAYVYWIHWHIRSYGLRHTLKEQIAHAHALYNADRASVGTRQTNTTKHQWMQTAVYWAITHHLKTVF
ncbi:hypothetical protein [Undibacterium sp.]|uniref:hypothetical protein n=1 Tax=Undibacterium sp. TaxID=1914977 RepID=UPI0025FA7631|nr:hypothetical protein [Undibacterium sp.]